LAKHGALLFMIVMRVFYRMGSAIDMVMKCPVSNDSVGRFSH
jgi:hypothetical protein